MIDKPPAYAGTKDLTRWNTSIARGKLTADQLEAVDSLKNPREKCPLCKGTTWVVPVHRVRIGRVAWFCAECGGNSNREVGNSQAEVFVRMACRMFVTGVDTDILQDYERPGPLKPVEEVVMLEGGE